MSYWRDAARSVIAKAIEEGNAQGLEGKALEKHVSAAYPFGEREMHPYKIWISEVAFQLSVIPGTKAHDRLKAKKAENLRDALTKDKPRPLFDKPTEGT